MSIVIGSKAPDFMLADQNGTMHSLAEYAGMYVLLYFYPKDDTPGCTTEACNFRDRLNELREKKVQVLGVSADDTQSHKKFAEKFHLNFPLLSDPEKKVIQAYSAWGERKIFGKILTGIMRESFLINKEGIIVKHYKKVEPANHTEEVLEDVSRQV